MNKKILLIALIALNTIFAQQVNAQTGAAINISGATADPSSILDISSTSAGILIPRMTTNQRNAITSPAEGLQILNTDNKCFEFFVRCIKD